MKRPAASSQAASQKGKKVEAFRGLLWGIPRCQGSLADCQTPASMVHFVSHFAAFLTFTRLSNCEQWRQKQNCILWQFSTFQLAEIGRVSQCLRAAPCWQIALPGGNACHYQDSSKLEGLRKALLDLLQRRGAAKTLWPMLQDVCCIE